MQSKLDADAIALRRVMLKRGGGSAFEDQNIKNVRWLADGSGILTEKLGMLCKKDNLGFGTRSWRYAAVINNGIVEQMFAEEGKCDNHTEDPYDISSPENVYEKL